MPAGMPLQGSGESADVRHGPKVRGAWCLLTAGIRRAERLSSIVPVPCSQRP